MSDFENDDYDEDLAAGFDGLPNTNQEKKQSFLKEENEEKNIEEDINENISNIEIDESPQLQQKPQEDTGKIKIDISSVEKLTGALRFAAANLERSVEKVDKVNNLADILTMLKKIDAKEYEDLFIKVDKRIEESTQKIEDRASKKLELAINKNLKEVNKTFSTAAKKYKEYAEVFEDPDVMEVFQEISELKNFRKKFNFKSIIATTSITAGITLIASYLGYSQLYSYKLESAKNEIYNKNKKIMSVMQYAKNVRIKQNNQVKQLHFNNPKMQLMLLNDGTMVVQLDKNVNKTEDD